MKFLIFSIFVTTQLPFNYASFFEAPFRCYATDAVCTTLKAREIYPGFLQTLPDPLTYESLEVNAGGLQYELKNVNIYGLNGLYIDHFSIDPITNMTRAIFHMNILGTSRYKANGTIFNTPIYGHGDMFSDFKNVEFEVIGQYDFLKGVDGLLYANPKDYQFRYDVRDNFKLTLSNLYDGNKDLSDYMHYIFEQNWKMITELYTRDFFQKITDIMFYAARTYSHSIPLENIFVL